MADRGCHCLFGIPAEKKYTSGSRPEPASRRQHYWYRYSSSIILLSAAIALLLVTMPVQAGDWTGGAPLVTIRSGNVTGDLWMDVAPAPDWGYTNITKTFTIPAKAIGNITWAKLYVVVYCGHMQNDYAIYITNRWDGNGDGSFGGTYDRIWVENGHAPFNFIAAGGNDNSGFPGHGPGEPVRMINDHEERSTSDYIMWYDVKDLLRNSTVFLNVITKGSFDGRIKATSLLVAYDNPDSDTLTHYWVNAGSDQLAYLTEDNYGSVDVGRTTFDTEGVGPVTSARLTDNYLASSNGYYAFPTDQNDFAVEADVTGSFTFNPLSREPDVQGPYSGVITWDLTPDLQDAVRLGRDPMLAYARFFPAGKGLYGYYKNFLAILVTKGPLKPAPDFIADATTGTAPLTVRFSDRSKGGSPANWYWDFDNNGIIDDTTRNPSYTYTSPGTYAVRLIASNAGGANETVKTGLITVTSAADALPVPRFSAAPRSGTAPLAVQFTDASLNSPTGWNWSFGDGNFSVLQNPSHTYGFAGSFTVALNATNAAGSNTTSAAGYIAVSSPSGSAPVAAFSATPVSGTVPLTVLFTDTSTNSPTSRVWDFGDGNSTWSTAATTFAHTFANTGTYTVKLTVTNGVGSDDETKTGYITVTSGSGSPIILSLSPRIQSFGIGDTREYQIVLDSLPRGLAGYDMTVIVTNASVAEITRVTYPSWAQLSKTPIVPNRSVRLNAVDTNQQIWPGAVNTVLANITVRGIASGMTPIGLVAGEMSADGGGLPITLSAVNNGSAVIGSYAGPVADFAANTTAGKAPLTVLFSDQSSGSPTAWAWDFNNDGTTDSTLQNPLATFTTAGAYTVSLKVTNAAGSDTLVKQEFISVVLGSPSAPTAPVAGFSATPVSGTVPLTVLFTDTSTNSPTSRAWDFGDGNSSWSTTSTTFAHTYTTAGSYTVKLTATNDAGSDDEIKTGYITATAASTGPVASFTASPTSGTVSLLVTFTDRSTGSPWYWKWDFGDGYTSTTKSPKHTYTTAGIYTASLQVSADGSTWSAPATEIITVNTASGAPGASFTVSATSGQAPLTVTFTDTSSGTPTSWAWDFDNDGDTDSTSQNPSYEYSTAGTYTAKLTATNNIGSGTASKTITVTASSTPPDLTVEAIIPNYIAGGLAGGSVFALEQNPVTIKVKNGGTGSSAATTVKLESTDGFSGTATVPTLAAGAETLVAVTDTKLRSSEISITYTATVDPGSVVTESSESNNVKTGSFSVKYNGYKGKRYWSGMTGGGDITTKYTYDIKGGLLYSRGDSEYTSGSFGEGGWLTHTVKWAASDLPIPSGATVKKVLLYVPYTWDNEHIIDSHTTIDFNSERISRSNWYWDQSNFGSYANYAYGLSTYDVTSRFEKNAANTAVFTRENPAYDDPAQAAIYTKLSMYEFFLVVIYEDSTASRKQIFLNEGFDLLGASLAYGTTPAECIAYVPFTGMTIDTAAMEKATLITFVPSGDSNEGNILYNGNVIASNVWAWGGSGTGANGGHQVADDVRVVTSSIQSTGNTFAIQSTIVGPDVATPCMCAAHQFLIIDYGGGTSQSDYSTDSTSSSSSSSSSTKETVSTLLTQSGVAASSPGQTGTLSSPTSSPTGSSGSVRNMLAPSIPTSGEILDNPPVPDEGGGGPGSDFPPIAYSGAMVGSLALIGFTAFAYKSGILATAGVFSGSAAGSAGSSLSLPSGQRIFSTNGRFDGRYLTGGILVSGIIIVILLFGIPALTGYSGMPETGGASFTLLPTVERIGDLDTANHAPDYPAGFSARNGILFVYAGAGEIKISDLELRLSKGTDEVFITASSHPPAANAVNPGLSSYFEEMGNGDGTLSDGEWLMVYADNCYDSSTSDSNPRGQVLVWQPGGSGDRVEVPVKDTIGYTMTDTGSGNVLQQGTLQFFPP